MHTSTDTGTVEPVDLAGASNLCELFQATVARCCDEPAVRDGSGVYTLTWREYGAQVQRLAAGLHGLGVRGGDTVALMMDNRPEFHLLDTAVLHLGATAFSIYTTFAPDTIRHLLSNAGARIVIGASQYRETLVAASADTRVEHLLSLPDRGPPSGALSELDAFSDPGFDFERSWRAVEKSAVATLIYTSGTTGPPKGVELTHANILAQLRATAAVLPVHPGDRVPSAFPMAHAAERWASHYQAMAHGLEVTCVDDLRELPAVLAQLRPDIWGSVPRIWEKLYAGLRAAIAGEPDDARRQPMLLAVEIALAHFRAAQDHRLGISGPPSEELAAARRRADGTLELLRARVGLDRVRWAVVGSAPTPMHVLEFFAAIGVPVCEVWGMSELSACATANPPGEARLGTVGRALPGVDIRLAGDGEVEVAGEIVMRGYRGEPEKTGDVMTADGWLRTGDIGTIDGDGFLSIVDRKKELIINASGKNMSPANIEAALKSASPLIAQAVAIGDGRAYITALIVLDPEVAAVLASEGDAVRSDATLRALAVDPRVQLAVAVAVEQANEKLARVEQVKRHAILPDVWEAGSELLTPTLKLKRRAIAQRYEHLVADLYAT